MSRLEEIREGLYSKIPDQTSRPPREDFGLDRRPPDALGPPAKEKEVKPLWESSVLTSPTLLERAYLSQWRSRHFTGRAWFILAVLTLIGLGVFIGYTVFFAAAPVTFEILGPDSVTAGEFTPFTMRIVNRGGAALKEGVITLNLPEGALLAGQSDVSSLPLRIKLEAGDVSAGGEFQKEMRIRFLGVTNQTQRLSGLYIYRPENISSKLTRSAEADVTIVRVPVAIAADAPEKISSGQEFSFSVSVDAETASPLPVMTLGIDFPSGFELKSADPQPKAAGANIWAVTNLESGTSTKITIRGVLKGEPAEVKAFHIRFGRYDEAAKTWLLLAETTVAPAMVSPLLLVETSIDGLRQGAIKPGARLEGRVLFKNNLEGKIQNLAIALSFPERFVELETIQAEDGFYDVIRRAIVWNPSTLSRLQELDPGEEGVASFSFNLKSNPPIRSFSDKNLVFQISTAIDSASPPPEHRGLSLAYGDSIEFKIESRLTLVARAAYYDSPQPNSGPLPPKVRGTTTYTVFWQLGSGANDLRNVEARARLAGGVEFSRVLGSDIGEINFNSASREVIWRIGTVSAATGILRPHASVMFQLALTPAENQVNTSPQLLKDLSSSGRDVFADTELSALAEDLTTELRTDSKSTPNDWRVVP